MSDTKIKLCGMRRPEDVAAVNAVRPDFCGFVIDVPRSRRSVTVEEARALSRLLSPEVQAVGVFVNEAPEIIAGLYRAGAIALAQLHGGEDEGYIAALRSLCPVPIIQAFRVTSHEDLRRALASTADHILLDHGSGGTGQAFDWGLLRGFSRPYILAGGLGPENLERAIAALHPWAVDLSSGLETGGVKDPEKMRRAVAAVRCP